MTRHGTFSFDACGSRIPYASYCRKEGRKEGRSARRPLSPLTFPIFSSLSTLGKITSTSAPTTPLPLIAVRTYVGRWMHTPVMISSGLASRFSPHRVIYLLPAATYTRQRSGGKRREKKTRDRKKRGGHTLRREKAEADGCQPFCGAQNAERLLLGPPRGFERMGKFE